MKRLSNFIPFLLLTFCLTMYLRGALREEEVKDPQPTKDSATFAPATLSFNVVLEPLYYTVIYSQITSPVLKINKRMGDSFIRDDILIKLDKKVFAANYEKAKAAVKKYQSELEAIKVLYADDALSLFELNTSYASLATVQADLQEADKLLNAAEIRAPYNGKVVKVSIKEHELAQLGKELITIVNNDVLFAKFVVPSRLLACLTVGTPVEIDIHETGDKISSHITRIAPVIDPSSSTILVEAEIKNNQGNLLGGMIGTVKIHECTKDSTIERNDNES